MSGELQRNRQVDWRTAVARLLLGLVLSVGGAIVWLVIVAISSEWLAQWFHGEKVLEGQSIVFRRSGEPVIEVHRFYGLRGSRQSREFRTLDDQPVELSDHEANVSYDHTWQVGPLSRPMIDTRANGPMRWQDAPEPLPWSLRQSLFSVYDARGSNPQFWFLHWPERRGGSAYWTVYDSTSKAWLGYLGRAGWSASVPPLADQFPAWDENKRDIAQIINDQPFFSFPPWGVSILALDDSPQPDVGLLYVTPHRDAIYVINQRRRTVEVGRMFPDAPPRGISVRRRSVEVPDPLDESIALILRGPLLLSWPDHLEFTTATLKSIRTIPLPEELRDQTFQLVEQQEGAFLAEYQSLRSRPGVTSEDHRLVWFNEKGEVTRQRTVSLPAPPSYSDLESEYLAPPLSLMPISILQLWPKLRGGYLFAHDAEFLRGPDDPLTWSLLWKRFYYLVKESAWPLALCLLSGLPFAVACSWRQRRVSASRLERVAWPLLVYLFGLVGWIAFVAHREWPRRRAVGLN